MRVWNSIALLLLTLLLIGLRPVRIEAVKSEKFKIANQSESKFLTNEVPILCYHNLTLEQGRGITVSQQRFSEHIKSLADSGYRTILPEQLYEHLTKGKSLPLKPIVISFDDGREAQYKIAAPILEKHGFKGVFFVMTVCLDKPGYLGREQLKQLSRRGHIIAAHTYDHPLLKDLSTAWEKQLLKPKSLLEKTIGQPVQYFAYPNGTWNETVIQALKKQGYKAAFQLNGARSAKEPLYTIRRLMVDAGCSATHLQRLIKANFH